MLYRLAANPDGTWSVLSGDEVLSTHPTWIAADERLRALARPEELMRQPRDPRGGPTPKPSK